MEQFAGTISPPGMYVRALYDYISEDRTSLSFSAGDIIQVLTQLESGWWDGVIDGQRGWFPSNYCVMVGDPEARRLDQGLGLEREADSAKQTETETETEPESEDDYEDRDLDSGYQESFTRHSRQPNGRMKGPRDQEEGAFWIPQITETGSLYYLNTLTGVSTMELPMETPMPQRESIPRDGTNLDATSPLRAAPELLSRGVTTVDASETGRAALQNQRDSYISEGASPNTSMESLSLAQSGPKLNKDRYEAGSAQQSNGSTITAVSLHDAVSLTWDQLLDDMRRMVQRYIQTIESGNKAEFVRRVEDISDHLRLLLAAASGTTDSHSGAPSIISSNRELYPRFRDMMSRFSKLVLNSHIAAFDYPPRDDYDEKCIQEANNVLYGVRGFVEVARAQRGEAIPRLLPTFIPEQIAGGNWRNNGLGRLSDSTEATRHNHDYEARWEANIPLNEATFATVRDLFRNVISELRRLEQKLVIPDKLINRQRHNAVRSSVSQACIELLGAHQPWMAFMESIDLTTVQNTSHIRLAKFNEQKQRVYNLIAELVIACQGVGAPLADEWSYHRGSSLEDRIKHVAFIAKEYENCVPRTIYALESLAEASSDPLDSTDRTHSRGVESWSGDSIRTHQTSSSKDTSRSVLTDISYAASSGQNKASQDLMAYSENAKVARFFGEVPVASPQPDQTSSHPFLKLDHEGEVRYDKEKSEPTAPVIRGGTLTALVEQLTRHDLFNRSYLPTFLLTYRSFTNATELFEMLVRRWSIQPPPGLTEQDYNVWVEHKQTPIRIRTVNVLKSWMEYYWMESNDDASQDVLNRLWRFATETVVPAATHGHNQLVKVVEQRAKGEEPAPKRLRPNDNPVPTPIVPKNMRKMKYSDIDPTEYARQLTIIDFKLYIKIRPQECLNRLWKSKSHAQDPDSASSIKALINHSNHLTNWVADTIVSFAEPKKRAAVIKHFAAVAERCLSINNFSALTAILAAFGSSPIHRLTKTWDSVDKKTRESVERLRILMSSVRNFANYRDALHNSSPPVIPFLGVYLTDLTFIDEANSNTIKKTDLINFAKRSKIAEVIIEIQQFQNMNYNFKSIPELQDYILGQMENAPDVSETEMYDRSLKVEPREREDEKIARLLTQGGYI